MSSSCITPHSVITTTVLFIDRIAWNGARSDCSPCDFYNIEIVYFPNIPLTVCTYMYVASNHTHTMHVCRIITHREQLKISQHCNMSQSCKMKHTRQHKCVHFTSYRELETRRRLTSLAQTTIVFLSLSLHTSNPVTISP